MPADGWRHQRGVYFFFDGDDRIKIGYALDPASRGRRGLQIGNSQPLTLLAVAVGKGPDVERKYHEDFAHARVPGRREWFKVCPELTSEIQQVQREYENIGAPPVPGGLLRWRNRDDRLTGRRRR